MRLCRASRQLVLIPQWVQQGAQWLSDRVLDSRLRGCKFEHHRRHCVVSLSKTHLSLLNLVQVQPRKTRPNKPEKLVNWVMKNQILKTKQANQRVKQHILFMERSGFKIRGGGGNSEMIFFFLFQNILSYPGLQVIYN